MEFSTTIMLLSALHGTGPGAESPEHHSRIACLGRETPISMFLTGTGRGSYPQVLGRLLRGRFDIRTFRSGGNSYQPSPATPPGPLLVDTTLLKWNPDLVFVEPGVVDSGSPGDREGGLTEASLAGTVTLLGNQRSHPRIILLLPAPASPGPSARDSLLLGGTIDRIRSVAYSTGCEVIDTHSLLFDGPDHTPGEAMTADRAAGLVARRLRELLSGDEAPGIEISRVAPIGSAKSNYYGYECFEFKFRGREAKIVRPKRAAKGFPWIWRARFWGHEPQTEIALLERGFHVTYCDAAELFGNDEALGLWDGFYAALTDAGLSKKAVLEGFSRGGMYVYRWALHNPGSVACVYADAPVLDMKSWPGGKGRGGGNPAEWLRFKYDFALQSEQEALAFRENPLDRAQEIAHLGFPMLHICGLADVTVPIGENTDPFEKRILASGGRITVIRKPGIGHHPHSLPNPRPIVEFILRAVKDAPPG